MNYNAMTTEQLLDRTQVLNWIKNKVRSTDGYELSPNGLERVNDELSAIEWELIQRQLEGEFVTLWQMPNDWYTDHSPYCGVRCRGCSPSCHKATYERIGLWLGNKDVVGFSPLYGSL